MARFAHEKVRIVPELLFGWAEAARRAWEAARARRKGSRGGARRTSQRIPATGVEHGGAGATAAQESPSAAAAAQSPRRRRELHAIGSRNNRQQQWTMSMTRRQEAAEGGGGDVEAPQPSARSVLQAEREHGIEVARDCKRKLLAGMALVYAAWGVLVWICFACERK